MLRTIITLIYILVTIALSAVILMQEGKGSLGSLAGQQSTFWSKVKSRSTEGRMRKLTYVLSALFFVLAILLSTHPFA